MNLRVNAGYRVTEWASMGYWATAQFGLLFTLSARLPDLTVSAFECPKGTSRFGECADIPFVARVGSEYHVSTVSIAACPTVDIGRCRYFTWRSCKYGKWCRYQHVERGGGESSLRRPAIRERGKRSRQLL